MEIFFSTLNQMLLMLVLILTGIILKKKHILSDESQYTLAKIETHVLLPALSFYTWSQKCTTSTLTGNAKLILFGMSIAICSIFLANPLSGLFVRNIPEGDERVYQRDMYKYALALANYGYVGNFIVLNVFGSDAFFRYSMFTFGLNFISYSWGIYMLTPKHYGSEKSLLVLLKGFLTPPLIGLLIGMVLGLTQTSKYVPDFIMSAASNAGSCMGPIAMLLAGLVVGEYDIKLLLGKWKIYIVSFLRLVILPGIFLLVFHCLKVNKEIMTFALIAFGGPIGLNTIVYPTSYGQDANTGASMVMTSQILSVLTIPIMYYFFILL